MWMLVMFDLPVVRKKERKAATDFRKHLEDLGFERTQLSVYMRVCPGKERVKALVERIKTKLPDGGVVDIITFTDKQYENIITFHAAERMPGRQLKQLSLF
jgi:CRISPR-associated protein Cas2